MLIAQGSIDVDENATLAQNAHEEAKSVGNQLVIFKNDMSAEAQALRQEYADSIKQMDGWKDQQVLAQDNLKKELQGSIDSLDKQQRDTLKTIEDTQYTVSGRVTNSYVSPAEASDRNAGHHQNGDLWIQQISKNGQDLAGTMFHYFNGAWLEQRWDQETLAVENLSALSADLGEIHSGNINGVTIQGTIFASSMDGDDENEAGDFGKAARTWNTDGFNVGDKTSPGMHIQEGLLRMKARRTSGGAGFDHTYLGPNELKVRNTYDGNVHNGIYDRADITSTWIEIGQHYNTPHTGQGAAYRGCSINSDGSAVVSDVLYVDYIKSGDGGHVKIGSKIETPYRVETPGIDKSSDASIKNIKEKFDNKRALAEIKGTDIYNYFYKGNNDDKNIGPVIDDINDINKADYNISEYMVKRNGKGKDVFSLDNTIGLLIGAVNELSDQNEKLLGKISQLEAKVNGNY